jgi:hypothetical protein
MAAIQPFSRATRTSSASVSSISTGRISSSEVSESVSVCLSVSSRSHVCISNEQMCSVEVM